MLCPDCSRVAACSARKGIKTETTRHGNRIRREEWILHKKMIREKVATVIGESELESKYGHYFGYVFQNSDLFSFDENKMLTGFVNWMLNLMLEFDKLKTHKDDIKTNIGALFDIFLNDVLCVENEETKAYYKGLLLDIDKYKFIPFFRNREISDNDILYRIGQHFSLNNLEILSLTISNESVHELSDREKDEFFKLQMFIKWVLKQKYDTTREMNQEDVYHNLWPYCENWVNRNASHTGPL